MHFLAAWRHNRKLAAFTKNIEAASNSSMAAYVALKRGTDVDIPPPQALEDLLDYSEGNLGIKGQTFPSGDRTYTSREFLRNVYAILLSGGLETRMATHAISTAYVAMYVDRALGRGDDWVKIVSTLKHYYSSWGGKLE